MRGIKSIPIVLAFLPGMAIAAGALTPSTLLAHVTQYDHQHVAVTGTVSDIQPRVSHRGNAYETFRLCDSKCVTVFAWGHPGLPPGSTW